MRVLHVIPGLSPKDGGPTEALHAMAAATAALGADVEVAASDDDAGGRLDVPLGRPVRRGDVTYRYFARSLPGSWKVSFPMVRWLRREVRNYDVVHVHAAFSFSTIPAVRFAHRSGIPVVYRPLGTLSPWSLQQHAWKKRPYYALVERGHLARADAIHVTARSEGDEIANLGFGDRVRIIPLGVTCPPRSILRARTSGPLRLLFLSRLHPKKGLFVLLDALTIARDMEVPIELTIAGDGPDGYRRELERRVREQKLDDAVNFAGHVAGAGKHALFERSDVFILPSFQENFGIAVAEALASGLPVIISDQVGLAPDVERAGAGIVTSVDAAAVARAIADLAADGARRQRMGMAGFTLAREQYSWQQTAQKLMRLYTELRMARRR